MYLNHLDQVKEQLSRPVRALPTIKFRRVPETLQEFVYEDIELVGYDPHPTIKAPIAVMGGTRVSSSSSKLGLRPAFRTRRGSTRKGTRRTLITRKISEDEDENESSRRQHRSEQKCKPESHGPGTIETRVLARPGYLHPGMNGSNQPVNA